MLFFQRVAGKPDLFAILYDEVVCCFARREGVLYDRFHLLTSRLSSIVYYCISSLSLANMDSCLFIVRIRAGYMLIVSSIVAARLSPISLDRLSKSSRNCCVHLIWNFLSFVMTYFLNCMDIFVMTNGLSLHSVCHDIFVYTSSLACHDTNISTKSALSTPRPHLFAYKPLCYAIIV